MTGGGAAAAAAADVLAAAAGHHQLLAAAGGKKRTHEAVTACQEEVEVFMVLANIFKTALKINTTTTTCTNCTVA